jgi:cell division protein FtsB
MDALKIKESQKIEQNMLLEDKKFLLFRAQSELDACKKHSEDLEQELSLLKRQMEYIQCRVDKGFFRRGRFEGYLGDFFTEESNKM